MSDHLGDAVAGLIDGRLSHGERERALSHLAHCPACRREVDAERYVKASLQALCAPEPGLALRARLLGMAVDPTGPLQSRAVTDPAGVRSRSAARPIRVDRRAPAASGAPSAATAVAAGSTPAPAGPAGATPARRAGDAPGPRALRRRRAGDPAPALDAGTAREPGPALDARTAREPGPARDVGPTREPRPAGRADGVRPASRRRRVSTGRRRIGAGGALIVLGLGVALVLGGPDPVTPPRVDPGADGFVTSYVTSTNGVPLRDPASGADVVTRPAGQSR